jgi:hypothetical protein
VAVRFGPKGGEPGAPGADFVPDAGATVSLDAGDVVFDPDHFEEALTAPAAAVRVSATVTATPEGTTASGELAGLLTTRLTVFVASLAAGAVVDAAAVLDALRDDARYQIDPLTLVVRFSFADSFVEVASGGAAFTVAAGQNFTVDGVTVQ